MNKPDFNLLAEDTYPDGENMCSIKRKAFVTGAAAIWNLQSAVPSSGKSLEEIQEEIEEAMEQEYKTAPELHPTGFYLGLECALDIIKKASAPIEKT